MVAEVAWAVGHLGIALVVGLIILPLMIAGGALLAIGLAQKKRALWLTGIVPLCVPVALLILGAFLLFVRAMA